MKYRVRGMLLAALSALAVQGGAEDSTVAGSTPEPVQATASSADDAFNFFLQEAQVVTASRRAQKKSDSPVAIDVITRSEIEKSGARNIYDLLRFRVGVDVVEGNSIEGNPVLVNIRGLPEEFTQSLQVLVDGRSIVSTINSGVYWRRLPVAMDEIERIEIVRGPNSALFGANAGQGVINIITLKPGQVGGRYKVELGTLGQRRANMALDEQAAGFAVRGSFDTSSKSSSFTPFGEQPQLGNRTDEDLKASLRAVGPLWENSEADFSAGYMGIKYSYPVALGVGGDTGTKSDYASARLTHVLGDQASLEGSFWRRSEVNSSSQGQTSETVLDGDLLMRQTLMEGASKLTFGVSGRQGHVVAPGLFSHTKAGATLASYTRKSHEIEQLQQQRRAYISNQLALTEQLSLALAASAEASETGGQWPAYQGAFIYKPLEDAHLRLSGSKSPTMPSLLNKHSRLELITGAPTFPYPGPFPPASIPRLPIVRVEGRDITPPQVASYELTLGSAAMERRINLEVTGFQMEISGYPEFVDQTPVNLLFGGGFVPEKVGYVIYYDNRTDLVMRGTETTLTFKPAVGSSLQVNHTYQDVQTNRKTDRYFYTTPWNKVNFIANQELWFGLNMGAALGWKGEHRVSLPSKQLSMIVPDQAKLDLRVGYRPIQDVEFFAVGTNLDHAYRTEAPDGLTATQSYAGGLNISWGGSSK